MARAFLELTALPNAGSGGGDTGENGTPVTFSGNVKRVEDRIELVAARMLGGIEHKNDRCIIAGYTSSDDETGDYQLDGKPSAVTVSSFAWMTMARFTRLAILLQSAPASIRLHRTVLFTGWNRQAPAGN